MKATIEDQIRDVMGDTAYDTEQMFPEREGMMARARVRAKLKLLKQLLPGLRSALLEGEELRYVARGYILHWWEQVFAGGGVAYYTNITCVVLTDRRLLLVNTNSRGRQQHYRNQIPYTEINDVKMRSFSAAAKLNLKDGSTLTMGGFRGADRKQMRQRIPELVGQMPAGAPRLSHSLQYVCPRCSALYTELTPVCTACRTPFKNAKKAALLSLVLPGLGDLYLGHRLFGVSELFGSIVEWVILISAAVAVAQGEEEGAMTFLLVWIAIVAFTNIADYFLTRAMGRKGLIAAGKSG